MCIIRVLSSHLGLAQLVQPLSNVRTLDDLLRHFPLVARQRARKRPEVVKELRIQTLGGEARAAHTHRLQHT